MAHMFLFQDNGKDVYQSIFTKAWSGQCWCWSRGWQGWRGRESRGWDLHCQQHRESLHGQWQCVLVLGNLILKYTVKFCIQVSLIFFHWIDSKYKGVTLEIWFYSVEDKLCSMERERGTEQLLLRFSEPNQRFISLNPLSIRIPTNSSPAWLVTTHTERESQFIKWGSPATMGRK